MSASLSVPFEVRHWRGVFDAVKFARSTVQDDRDVLGRIGASHRRITQYASKAGSTTRSTDKMPVSVSGAATLGNGYARVSVAARPVLGYMTTTPSWMSAAYSLWRALNSDTACWTIGADRLSVRSMPPTRDVSFPAATSIPTGTFALSSQMRSRWVTPWPTAAQPVDAAGLPRLLSARTR